MITIDNKELRNLQEQVAKNQADILKIEQSLGEALPEPIAGPTGPAGATGATGATGARGPGIYGVTSSLPDASNFDDGDMYLLFNGDIYKKIRGVWVRQANIIGPQGIPGDGEVAAVGEPNPADSYQVLEGIRIDGVKYHAQAIKILPYGTQSQTLRDDIQAEQNAGKVVFVLKDGIYFTKAGNFKFAAIYYKTNAYVYGTCEVDAANDWSFNESQVTGPSYTAGIGIDITNNLISIEQNIIETVAAVEENVEFDSEGSASFGHDVYADGNLQAGNDVEVGRNLYIDDITKIQDPNGNQLAQAKLTAGANITIQNNVISATGGTSYTAGSGIEINRSIISNTGVLSVNGNTGAITNIATSTDLQQGLATRQPLGNYATVTQLNAKSTVTGTNDGTNWTSLTVDGTTKAIPQGGGGGTALYKHYLNTTIINGNTYLEFISTSPNPISNMSQLPKGIYPIVDFEGDYIAGLFEYFSDYGEDASFLGIQEAFGVTDYSVYTASTLSHFNVTDTVVQL